MGIYEGIFIIYYNKYGLNYGSKRVENSNFVTFIQLLQIGIIFMPFNFFGLLEGEKAKIAAIVPISIVLFNFFYYSNEKLNSLQKKYDDLSDKKKTQCEYLSTTISLITLIVFVGIMSHRNYIRDNK